MNPKICPPTRTVVHEEPHASTGIGKPYPQESCKLVMYLHDNYPQELHLPAANAAKAACVHACNKTIDSWLQRCGLLGHVRPFCCTGNKRAERDIRGDALINLSLYRSVRCKAFGYKVRAFLFHRNSTILP